MNMELMRPKRRGKEEELRETSTKLQRSNKIKIYTENHGTSEEAVL